MPVAEELSIASPPALEAPIEDANDQEEQVEQKDLAPNEMIAVPVWGSFMPLSGETYVQNVIEDTEHVHVIAFISPTCVSCHELSKEFRRMRHMPGLKNRPVRIGYVNIDNPVNDSILENHCGGIEVYYTPTILVYGADKTAPTEYTGDYLSDTIVPYVTGISDKDGFEAKAKDMELDMNMDDIEVEGNGNSAAVAQYGNTMADIGFLKALGEAAMDGLVDDFGSRGGGYIP